MFRLCALITWYLINWCQNLTKNHNRSQNKQTSLSLSLARKKRKWGLSPKGGGKNFHPSGVSPFPFGRPSLSSFVLELRHAESHNYSNCRSLLNHSSWHTGRYRQRWRSGATWSKDTFDHLVKQDSNDEGNHGDLVQENFLLGWWPPVRSTDSAPYNPTPRTGTKKRFVPCKRFVPWFTLFTLLTLLTELTLLRCLHCFHRSHYFHCLNSFGAKRLLCLHIMAVCIAL